jgi:hypothetical protein
VSPAAAHSAPLRATTSPGIPHDASAPATESSQPAGGGSSNTTAPRAVDAGVSSRRARLPTATHTSPSPRSCEPKPAAVSSRTRTTSESTSAESTRATSTARRFEAWRSTTISGSRRATAVSISTSVARAIERRTPNHERGCTANKSASSTTPASAPRSFTIGACRIPRSSISNSTSPASRSGVTENTGVVITVETGALSGSPAATIRVRMSRSVTIPNPGPWKSTIADVAPAAVIRRATSLIASIGEHVTVAVRISSTTGVFAGSRIPTASSRDFARSSKGLATAAGTR